MLNQNDSYLGNSNVKRDGVQTQFTREEVIEYKKCMDDPAYFATNYCKIISLDEGLVPFQLYPYQEKMFNHFNENRFSIVLACRQSGKSISSVIYILWYALFQPEKTIAILANKGATAREMLARVSLALENLPFFLQPGCKALNKTSIEFSNNSKILSAATSGSSIRGLSINLLFLDEFAFVENAGEFYTSTYPVVSAGATTRIIITSTANGLGNIYHKLWEGAVQGTNEFKPFKVDWWDVPGRDEEWRRQTISNTSELQFQQEFGNTFHGTGNTLISADCLLQLKSSEPVLIKENLMVYKHPEPDHNYIMVVDVAKGRGQDYSTFNVIDLSTEVFEQVAVYRDNMVSPLLFPNIIASVAKQYNEALVLLENNDAGAVVGKILYYDIEYENMYLDNAIKADAVGVTMNKKVKRIGCSNIKDLVEQKKLHVVDSESIVEMSTFVARGTSFEASDDNHDDLMMNLVLFGWFVNTEMFVNMTDIRIKDMIHDERLKRIEEELVPFGIIDNGIDEEVKYEPSGEGFLWQEVPRGSEPF